MGFRSGFSAGGVGGAPWALRVPRGCGRLRGGRRAARAPRNAWGLPAERGVRSEEPRLRRVLAAAGSRAREVLCAPASLGTRGFPTSPGEVKGGRSALGERRGCLCPAPGGEGATRLSVRDLRLSLVASGDSCDSEVSARLVQIYVCVCVCVCTLR